MKKNSKNRVMLFDYSEKYFFRPSRSLACPLHVKTCGLFINERMNAMTNAIKYTGLCETCDHDPTCMLRRMPHLEVIQCEEFSIQPAPNNTVSAPAESSFMDPAESSRMGLCSNCLNVLTCGFSQTLRGVQHCEEYALDEAGVIPPLQPQRSESAA
jgi:hypothetical protein